MDRSKCDGSGLTAPPPYPLRSGDACPAFQLRAFLLEASLPVQGIHFAFGRDHYTLLHFCDPAMYLNSHYGHDGRHGPTPSRANLATGPAEVDRAAMQ